MNAKILVSGSIVSELSEKIPSNIIALNELIKNSYDAGASSVDIVLDTDAKTLLITDDGSGMDQSDIDTLFHIAKSVKQYGNINEYGRYTQGAKGLGFLSVFKFGAFVEWKTCKKKGLKFSVDFNTLLAAEDLSQIEIDIFEDDTIEKGTAIHIQLTEYNAESLKNYFAIEKNYKKIINAFDDSVPNALPFTINLKVNDDSFSSLDTISVTENVKEHQLYYISYNSDKEQIKFTHNNYEVLSIEYPFDSTEYKVDIELVIFQFPPYGKRKVDQFFFNPQDDLTPLIFVNSNLFSNYDIFDPNIMKNIRTDDVLNQMIGFVRIISDDKMINFNSDRSQFLQNELTDSIRAFLSSINKKIQEIGSEHKKHLMKFDILTVTELPSECNDFSDDEQFKKFIKSDFSFRNEVKIERKSSRVKFSVFGKNKILAIKEKAVDPGVDTSSGNKGTPPPNGKNPSPPAKPSDPIAAKINLTCEEARLSVPTPQIDLKEYVSSVQDSDANSVEKSFLTIKIDGAILEGGILSSVVDSCQKLAMYSYLDSCTGEVVKQLPMNFFQPESEIGGENNSSSLITLPSSESYSVAYNDYVGDLINQINSLDITDYLALISCSLRAIFDLSIDSLAKSAKYPTLFHGISSLEDKVVRVVEYIESNNTYVGKIATSSKIDFHSLKNMLDPQRFSSAILTAHLGAHRSGAYISEPEIKQLSKLIGIFVVVTNEMLQNNDIS